MIPLLCRANYSSRYTDSPDGDWVIGRYPGDPGLFLATSGSGHAFKVRFFTSFSYFPHLLLEPRGDDWLMSSTL